jgi:HK97 gp10 family phage protein
MTVKKRVVWKPQKLDPLTNSLQEGLVAIGMQMSGDIKKSMSRSRTDRDKPRSKKKNEKGPITYASAVGQPPKPIESRLMNSISVNWTGSSKARGTTEGKGDISDGVGKPDGGKIKNGKKFKVVVGTNVQYAPYLEFGTRYIKPRPFMRPGFELHKKAIERKLAKFGKKGLVKI